MHENAASGVIWEKGSGPRSVSHWGEHPLSWWRNKIKNYRGDAPPKISIQVRTWDRSGQPAERREFDVDNLRGAKAFAKQWALDTNGSAVVEGRVHLYGEGIFIFEEFGEYRHQTPIEFYVWSVDEDFQPITRRGPWADRERDEAVRAARDIASQSNHHQVVTLGDDPGQVGFDIYKAFRARSGEVFLMSELGRVGGRLGEYRDNPEYRSGRMLVDYDSYDVRGVLAGAYRGRDTMERPTLTHVVFKKDDHDLRCGCSQPIDNVVDPYGAQVAGTPPTCPRCLKIWEKLPRELEMSEGYLGQQPNGTGYYVWVVDSSSRPLSKEGPYGPYHTLEGAKPYARISATEGAHDRIISRGRDPRSDDFEILRRYKARTGERVI